MGDDWPQHETGDEKSYRFRPFNGKTLRFQVKAAHDVHLAFTSGAEETDPMFEVFIGAWEGASSAVRFNRSDDLVKEDTSDIVSADEFREFWVAIDHDEVRAGRGGEWQPFMSCALPQPVHVTHFGYSTGWGAPGSWKFFHERLMTTEDKLEYNFEPLYGDTFTFSVLCDHDAHLCFSTGPHENAPIWEVFIGGWENQNSAIRKNKDTTVLKVDTPNIMCGEYCHFWINVRGGHIRVGYVGNPEPFLDWQDPEPFRATHVGYCTAWGATGKWTMNM